jgi:ribosomal 50S subunit-recycling heat shock protein
MRLDKFLKVSRLIKRRTLANEACDKGKVSLNGRIAKAGTQVSPGDRIFLNLGIRHIEVEVTDAILNPKSQKGTEYYVLLQNKRVEDEIEGGVNFSEK